MTTNVQGNISAYPPLSQETVDQLRVAGWSEDKIAKAAIRAEARKSIPNR